MSTNRQVCTAALRMLGVIDANETASIEDANLALTELNDLMESLAADGIDLGYPPQDDLSDDFPLDGRTEAQIKPILAMVLTPYYPTARPIDALPQRYDAAINQLTRQSILDNMEESRAAIPLGSGFTHAYDFDAGE